MADERLTSDRVIDERSVLDTVARMIRALIDEEWAEEIPIGMETSFANDLELESIEFVALAERLRNEYGERVDFAAWLAGMDLKEILALRVGQLVEYIERCESKLPTG
jgi:acyl carrier protein